MSHAGHVIVWTGIGIVTGGILSITPALLMLPLLLVCLIGYLVAVRSRRSATPRRIRTLCPLVGIPVMVLAACLPMKPLDADIGPVAYPPMPIYQLADALREAHGLRIDVRRMADTNAIVSLRTDVAISQAALLDRIGDMTGHDWYFLTCPNGATLLWGSHPDVIIFKKKEK